MRWYTRVSLIAVLLAAVSANAWAQDDLCNPAPPRVPDAARAEQLRILAAEKSERDAARRNWEVKLLPLKNSVSNDVLKALCIFRIEVVPQPAQKLVGVRAPKELMAAVEDAIRRLDVPTVAAKNVEITGYVLSGTSLPDNRATPVPQELQGVVNQLKNVMPANLYLADVVVTRGVVGQRISSQGKTSIDALVNYREGTPPTVLLDGLIVRVSVGSGGTFGPSSGTLSTNIEVPVGTYVVVGRITNEPGPSVATYPFVIVVTARILN